RHDAIHISQGPLQRCIRETQAYHRRAACGHLQVRMVEARFSPHMLWIDTVFAMDDVAMEGVLHPATPALRALPPHPRPVRFIVRKQGERTGCRIQIALANMIGKRQRRRRLGCTVVSLETDTAIALRTRPDTGLRQRLWPPGPGVAKP